MFQIGNYEILREFARSQHSIVYAARQIGDQADATGRYAVKVFDVESLGLLESVATGQTFLERATLQKRLAAHGAGHWADVEQMGDIDDVYYVAELFPLTAKRVIDRQSHVGAGGLYTIVWSVVRGLTELRETFRRAHGNLKLTNILIGGDEKLLSPKTTRVVLADPSVEAASARDRSADLLAIGELIHQLVLRRPFKPEATDENAGQKPVWPVPKSNAWSSLGPDGARWLELCNWLLSPLPADRPSDLVELAIALHRLTPQVSRIRWKWIAAAVIPIALAGAGIGAFWNIHSELRSEVQAVDQQWFGKLNAAMADPTRSQKYNQAGENLRDLASAIKDAKSKGVHFDIGDDALLSYGGYQNAKAALALSQRVEQDLSPDHWPRLATLLWLQRGYTARGWSQPAGFTATVAQGAQPATSADLPAGIDRVIDVSARIGDDAMWLEQTWPKYDADLQAAERTGDPMMTTFASLLRERVGSSLRLTDAGFDGLDAFRERLPLAAQLAKVAAAGFPQGYGRQRLKDDVESRLNLGNPSEDDIRLWLSSLDQYALVKLDPKLEPLAGLVTSFKKLTDEMSRQALNESEQTEYQTARSLTEEKFKALADAQFLKRDIVKGQGDIALRAQEVQRDLEALRKSWVRLDDPKQWFAFINHSLTTGSDVLKQRWKAYIDHQGAMVDSLSKDPERFKKIKGQTDVIRDVLTELDKQFPPVSSGLGEQLAAAAWEKREQRLTELTNWLVVNNDATLAPPDLNAFSDKVDAEGKAFGAFCGKLRDLAKDFPLAREILGSADRPDIVWATKAKAFWEDPIVQSLVKKDVARIAALASVPGMQRTQLIATARDNEATEVAIAAYRRLGETADGAIAWPTTAEDIDTDLTLRNRLVPMLNAIKSDAERKAPADEWRSQGAIRWRRYANQCVLESGTAAGKTDALEKRLAVAVRYRNAMLVAEADLDKLDPSARFNFALFQARVAITDESDVVVRTASTSLARSISALKGRPEVQQLSSRLGRLTEPEPMSADARLLAPQAPDSYSLTIRDNYILKFVRVEPANLRPFYLCTTELSLGQFIEIINTHGNWLAANTLLGNLSTAGRGGPMPLRGPRAWERPPTNDAPIDRFETWRYDTAESTAKTFVFDPQLRQYRLNRASIKPEFGDNPKYDHPLQQVPAQAAFYAAALANCRLPTTREWLAAYDMDHKTGGDVAKSDANLRDASFHIQVDFAAKDNINQWPDAPETGLFLPAGVKPTPTGTALPIDDHTVFFRTVTSGGGLFPNMVGNVAEIICDRADAFDAQPDRNSVDGVQKFCAASSGKIMVIGGSAFSPPELDVLRPYPLTSAATPYADVGARLAFTAPARTIAERLKWFLQEQNYLPAAAVAKAGG